VVTFPASLAVPGAMPHTAVRLNSRSRRLDNFGATERPR